MTNPKLITNISIHLVDQNKIKMCDCIYIHSTARKKMQTPI